MTKYTIEQIAKALGAEAFGDLTLSISAVQAPAKAGAGQLALAMDPSYEAALQDSNVQAAIVWPDADWQGMGLKAAIIAPRSRYILSGVTYLFENKPEIEVGIHASAVIASDAVIGENAAIGPFVIIGSGVKIGDNARIMSHTSVSEGAVIGADALLYPGVRIGARVQIGDGFICQSNTACSAIISMILSWTACVILLIPYPKRLHSTYLDSSSVETILSNFATFATKRGKRRNALYASTFKSIRIAGLPIITRPDGTLDEIPDLPAAITSDPILI